MSINKECTDSDSVEAEPSQCSDVRPGFIMQDQLYFFLLFSFTIITKTKFTLGAETVTKSLVKITLTKGHFNN